MSPSPERHVPPVPHCLHERGTGPTQGVLPLGASQRKGHPLILTEQGWGGTGAGLVVALFMGLWTLFFPDRNKLFSTSRGARKDASKILIVITDGEKTGDHLRYDDVIPAAEAAGILRYAVGVWCGLLPLMSVSPWRTPHSSLSVRCFQGDCSA